MTHRRPQHRPVLSMLSRLGWTPARSGRTTRCWDRQGRRSFVVVRLGRGFIAIEGASAGRVRLSPGQLEQLRSVLREASIDLGRLGGERLPARPPLARSE